MLHPKPIRTLLSALLLALASAGLASAQTTIDGVVNGASFVKGQAIAPGALISIFGSNLASTPALADTIPLSTTLSGVTVQFVTGSKSVDAPLDYVGQGQINAVVPWDLTPGSTSVSVTVTNKGKASNAMTVPMQSFSPGIFAVGNLAAVQNTDGSLAQPAGSIQGRTTHPAKIGSTIIIYATGLGPVDLTIPDGAIPPPGTLANTIHHASVFFGGHNAEIQFSGLSPQFVGVYQLNVIVPDIVPGDSVPLQLVLGGIETPKEITVAVSQ